MARRRSSSARACRFRVWRWPTGASLNPGPRSRPPPPPSSRTAPSPPPASISAAVTSCHEEQLGPDAVKLRPGDERRHRPGPHRSEVVGEGRKRVKLATNLRKTASRRSAFCSPGPIGTNAQPDGLTAHWFDFRSGSMLLKKDFGWGCEQY